MSANCRCRRTLTVACAVGLFGSSLWSTTALGATAVAAPREPTQTGLDCIDDTFRENTVDFDLAGGIGAASGRSDKLYGMLRARAGLLRGGWPLVVGYGVTGEWNSAARFALGVEADFVDFGSGWWFQVGGGVTPGVQLSAHTGFGWSLFGVEGGVRALEGGGPGWSLIAKLRLPVGHVIWGFRQRERGRHIQCRDGLPR